MNFYVVPFKVIPLRYNKLLPGFFPILEALLIFTFWYVLKQKLCIVFPQFRAFLSYCSTQTAHNFKVITLSVLPGHGWNSPPLFWHLIEKKQFFKHNLGKLSNIIKEQLEKVIYFKNFPKLYLKIFFFL